MANDKTLEDLFLDTLKDVYNAEKQALRAYPRIVKAVASDDLKAALEQHRDETETQVERLDRIFEMLGKPARGKTCEAMQGLVEESKEILSEFKGSVALDAGVIATAQAMEHYEISRYGTLRAWATALGMKDAAKLLEETLKEESRTDEKLTKLAETAANQKAA
ncbi:ferritin-like domain-containing protein [Salinarimonas rosea]|uniref:YciE/YciF ferroxidase family protein n=1 Tax=Salinarimonas rosea TaxID=552063 RepID=UPI0004029E6A|nr:ferritin-like domain-containing protein [Salinarimonas rosea]